MEGAKTQLDRANPDQGHPSRSAHHLRRTYETKFADYQNKYPGLGAEDIKNSICGTKAGVNGGVSPAEQG